MDNLKINIKKSNISYPIFINNNDIETLKKSILETIENKNYIVIFSKKVYKLYSKTLDFPKDKIFILKDGENEKRIKKIWKKALTSSRRCANI